MVGMTGFEPAPEPHSSAAGLRYIPNHKNHKTKTQVFDKKNMQI